MRASPGMNAGKGSDPGRLIHVKRRSRRCAKNEGCELKESVMAKMEVVLCNPVRTAIGTYGGTLKDTPAPALGAAAIREVLKRAALAPDKVEAVVMGNVLGAGVKMKPARQAMIAAGLPVQVPALTVNRV